MGETKDEKRKRILNSERKHDKPPPAVALVAVEHPAAEDVAAPFRTLLADSSKFIEPRGAVPTSVVIHCTDADNPASSTANFFHSPDDSGSAQAVADDIEGFTMVPDDAICAGREGRAGHDGDGLSGGEGLMGSLARGDFAQVSKDEFGIDGIEQWVVHVHSGESGATAPPR